MTDINELLKLYDNAIYLNDASEEEVKKLLKLSRSILDSIYDFTKATNYGWGRYESFEEDDLSFSTIHHICISLNEILDTIKDFKEIRV